MKSKKLPITKIDLDLLNPRHDTSINTQEKIIDHLVENEKIKVLAKDIALNGISPIDLIAVILDDNGRYTVVEGNRRICALTLLNKPNKHKESTSYFKKLKESSDKVPNDVECYVFDTRADADIWIERKHSGEQDGKGTTTWNATQKTRFNTRRGKSDSNALAQAILDYAIENNFFPESKSDGVLTTVTRYVSNPYFRNTLGIRSKSTSNEIKLDVPTEQFNQVISRFCSDLLEKDIISSRHKAPQITAYATRLIQDKVTPNERVEEHRIEIENDKTVQRANEPKPSIPSPVKSKDSSHPNARPYLIPETFAVTINNAILRRIYGELKNIFVNQQPLAAAMVCRVFLENIYERFHFSIVGSHNDMEVHKRIAKITIEIEKDTTLTKQQKSALTALKRIQSSTTNAFSPKVLGANAHGAFYPQPTELKAEWDNISEIILYMLNKIEASSMMAKK